MLKKDYSLFEDKIKLASGYELDRQSKKVRLLHHLNAAAVIFHGSFGRTSLQFNW